jgi:hydroxymethylpyrimidine/phosphomethylpyrimidine kinase
VLGYTAIGAVKTGMLATAELTEEVATLVEEHGLAPLVVDPVVMATSGGRLLEEKGVRVLRERLLPRCTLFTPNIPEAEILLGRSIRGRDQMVEAAAQLALFGPAAVLLKGGHLEGDESPDILWHGGHAVWLEGRRRGGNMSGTGCTLSAAIAANLALSADLEAACVQAKAYVAEVIGTGIAV